MDNRYLEKAASILKLPVTKVGGAAGLIRSAGSMKRNFGFHSMAKTPLIQRIKASLH
jgi:hypothetical protein